MPYTYNVITFRLYAKFVFIKNNNNDDIKINIYCVA